MNRIPIGLVLCATLCLTGCFSIDHAVSSKTGQEHVLVSNYGWRLFNVVPLCCGNATEKGRILPWAFFRNDVTIDKIQRRFMSYAASQGRTPQDLAYRNYDTVILEIPFTGITVPIPYVLCYHEVQLSGVLQ